MCLLLRNFAPIAYYDYDDDDKQRCRRHHRRRRLQLRCLRQLSCHCQHDVLQCRCCCCRRHDAWQRFVIDSLCFVYSRDQLYAPLPPPLLLLAAFQLFVRRCCCHWHDVRVVTAVAAAAAANDAAAVRWRRRRRWHCICRQFYAVACSTLCRRCLSCAWHSAAAALVHETDEDALRLLQLSMLPLPPLLLTLALTLTAMRWFSICR